MRKLSGYLLIAFGVFITTGICQSVVSAATPMNQAGSSKRITLNLDGVSLESALRAIAAQASLQLVIDKTHLPKRLVSANLVDVSVPKALDRVLAGTGWAARINGVGILAIVQSSSGNSKAQGIIVGKVTDARNSKGLGGVTVSVGGGGKTTGTDEDGSYRLVNISPGTYTITARQIGYAKQNRIVTIGEGATITADFKLEPSANILDQVIVTGTIASTELRAVPNAMTVITAQQIRDRGITKLDQLFRGDVPGLFALNMGSNALLDEVLMFSRGATALSTVSVGTNGSTNALTNPIKTYVDGVELTDSRYLSQIDPSSIERIEILAGPQASTVYGSNAVNGVMQIFTKRGSGPKPQVTLSFTSGVAQNNFSDHLAPNHVTDANISGVEGRLSYNVGGSWNYTGAWTPSKQGQRLGFNGGGRMDAGKVSADVSARMGLTKNKQRGDVFQSNTERRSNGEWAPGSTTGLSVPETRTLNSKTTGLTFGYRPLSWWSHEVVVGNDIAVTEALRTAGGLTNPTDTLVRAEQITAARNSQKYTTTLQTNLGSASSLVVTLGADHWRTRGSSWVGGSGTSLTGTFPSATASRARPGKNSGGFIQGQLALKDVVFFTYGLRAEWNPNYGDDAQPNLAPRYGATYSGIFGSITAKVRASYGRTTRPPQESMKVAVAAGGTLPAQFGPYYTTFANSELGPETQQGGEGGVELYWGSRGSLVITRYNQTFSNLISAVVRVDSVRSLVPVAPVTTNCGSVSGVVTFDANGYCYGYQSQNLNVGNIRNQGWELQGSLNTGPFTTHGVYSWTKSRIIGITQRYKDRLAGTQYEPGRPFDYMPEHVWSAGLTYARSTGNVSLTLNGAGSLYKLGFDDISVARANRLEVLRPLFVLPSNYRPLSTGYGTADLNATHRLNPRVDMLLQIQNLTNYYRNDYDVRYVAIGRQSRLGARIKLN